MKPSPTRWGITRENFGKRNYSMAITPKAQLKKKHPHYEQKKEIVDFITN